MVEFRPWTLPEAAAASASVDATLYPPVDWATATLVPLGAESAAKRNAPSTTSAPPTCGRPLSSVARASAAAGFRRSGRGWMGSSARRAASTMGWKPVHRHR